MSRLARLLPPFRFHSNSNSTLPISAPNAPANTPGPAATPNPQASVRRQPGWWPQMHRAEGPPAPIELRPIGDSSLPVAVASQPLPRIVLVPPYRIDIEQTINDQLDLWLKEGIPTTTLLSNVLNAQAGGPSIKAEVDGADERVERGQRGGSGRVADAEQRAVEGEPRADDSRVSPELEEGIQNVAPRACMSFYDMDVDQREQAILEERAIGGNAGIWFVQYIREGMGALSKASWDEFGKLRLWSARIVPCLYQSVAEPGRGRFDAGVCRDNVVGMILLLPFVVLFYLLRFIWRKVSNGKVFRPAVLILVTYFVLLYAFHFDALKLVIGVLKAVPGYVKEKSE